MTGKAMHQQTLFDEVELGHGSPDAGADEAPRMTDASERSRSLVRGRDGAVHTTPLQRTFERLTRTLAQRRRTLQRWQAFLPTLNGRIRTEYEPLHAEVVAARRALILKFDELLQLDGRRGGVPVRLRGRVEHAVLELVDGALDAGPDPEIEAVLLRLTGVDVAGERRDALREIEAEMRAEHGVEVDLDADDVDAEELARRLFEAFEAAEEAEDVRGAGTDGDDPERSRAPHGGIRDDDRLSVREIHRCLARQLHPDREQDPERRAHKTRLMQRANDAAAANDILTLLELQLETEQVDERALSELPEARLKQYNRLLRAQVRELDDEIADLCEPLRGQIRDRRNLTPNNVDAALTETLDDLQGLLEALEEELEILEDRRSRRYLFESLPEPHFLDRVI